MGKQLGIREFPAHRTLGIFRCYIYPVASPDVIASKLTRPMEESIAEANGIKNYRPPNPESRDKVSKARKQLPADVDPPIVQKASSPDNLVAFLEVESDTKDIKEVSHIASTVIKDRVQSIPGVINNVAIVA
ncbi:hypothetical protein FQR65_LT20276 [Abscondita terminalis]|nr:hypothetical protein FQR65_LT20276 [Abscondita terminalis]